MKTPYFIVFFLTIVLNNTIRAQIHPSISAEPYTFCWKIPIAQTGVFRLTFDDLKGIPPQEQLNIKQFAMYRLGQPVGLHCQSLDSLWNEGDTLLFFAQIADGTNDKALYAQPSAQAQPQLSLFSDTATYFLYYHPHAIDNHRILQQTLSTTRGIATTYFWQKTAHLFHDFYFSGLTATGTFDNEQLYESAYGTGEGWMSTPIKGQKSFSLVYPLPHKQGDSIAVTLRLIGQLNQAQKVWIYYNKNPVADTLWLQGSMPVLLQKHLLLASDTLNITLQGSSTEASFALASVGYQYQKAIEAQTGTWLWSTKVPRQLTFPLSSEPLHCWDISQPLAPIIIPSAVQNDTQILVHQANALFCFRQALPAKAIFCQPITYDTSANFYLITHAQLLADSSQVIQDYSAYRQSALGGGHRCAIINMEQVYQTFSFGDKSPLALKRFIQTIARHNPNAFFLLIGKGFYPTLSRFNPKLYAEDLVPPYGFPCSDTPYILDSIGNPIGSIGRIASNNASEIRQYLEKVQAFEQTSNRGLWQKRVLHLAGGRYLNEQLTFKSYLDSLANIVQAQTNAMQINTLSKTSDAPVEQVGTTAYINEGLSLLTSFGHSAIGQLDLDIGWASNAAMGYKNAPKYPFILVNGCDAGDSFAGVKALSTDWITSEKQGAIGFLAHTHLAYPPYLYGFSAVFYKHFFQDSIGLPVGKLLQKTVQELQKNFANPYWKTTIEQFSLQGDPAIRLRPALAKPDLSITKLSVQVQADSIRLTLLISNTGKVLTEKSIVRVVHQFEEKTVSRLDYRHNSVVNYCDTLRLSLPYQLQAQGIHRLVVQLDAQEQYDEWDEQNNQQIYTWLEQDAAVSVFSPALYSIVDTTTCLIKGIIRYSLPKLSLVIQANPDKQTYQQTYPLPTQGYFAIPLTLLTTDSLTYFWTIRQENRILQQGSFTYSATLGQGWTQLTPQEWQSLTTDSLTYLSNGRWQRKPYTLVGKAIVAGADVSRGNYLTEVSINQTPYLNNGLCYPWNSLNALTFRQNLQPYSLLPSLSCGCSPYFFNNLEESLLPNQNALEKYLEQVPWQEYVLLLSHGRINPNNWGTTIQQHLQNFGINIATLKALRTGTPFFILAQKGGKVLVEQYGKTSKDTLQINFSHHVLPRSSALQTPWIGPARAWHTLKSSIASGEHFVKIYGKNTQGDSVLLMEKAWSKTLDLHTIQATDYPYLSVQWSLQHNDTNTVQSQGWAVIAEPLDQDFLQVVSPIQHVFQDQAPLQWQALYRNVGQKTKTDTLLLQQQVLDQYGDLVHSQSTYIPTNQQDSLLLRIRSTPLAIGKYWLHLWGNPNKPARHTQVLVPFQIEADQQAPQLSVTLYNRLVEQWQAIPATAQLSIALTDDNPFKQALRLTIEAKACATCAWQSQEGIFQNLWIEANRQTATWHYQPQFSQSDTTWLRVQGYDASGNRAALQPYQIALVRATDIATTVLTYPNPSTQYLHFLVSNPTYPFLRIEIFDNLGTLQDTWQEPLYLGKNDLLWNARKKDGSFLPNGLYFYKIFFLSASLAQEEVHTGKISIYR